MRNIMSIGLHVYLATGLWSSILDELTSYSVQVVKYSTVSL